MVLLRLKKTISAAFFYLDSYKSHLALISKILALQELKKEISSVNESMLSVSLDCIKDACPPKYP